MRQAIGQSVDIAVDAIDRRDLARHPVAGDFTLAGDKTKNRQRKLGVGRRRSLAIIRDLAGVPKPRDIGGGFGVTLRVRVPARRLQSDLVDGDWRAGEPRMIGRLVEGRQQGFNRGKIQIGIAPLQQGDRIETMILKPFDQIRVEGRTAAGCAE